MSETQPLDQFVQQQIQSGKYADYDAMVKAGLKLLQQREAEAEGIAEQLRPAAQRYLRGEPGILFDADDFIRRARQRNADRPHAS